LSTVHSRQPMVINESNRTITAISGGPFFCQQLIFQLIVNPLV